MARVHIPALLRGAAQGREWVSATGATVREVVVSLEKDFPDLRGRLVNEGRLMPSIVVAIDGEISSLGLADAVNPDSELQFISAIAGGRNRPSYDVVK